MMRVMTDKQAVYDELAGVYVGNFDVLTPAQVEVRASFAAHLKATTATPALLDVGSGTGRDLKFFADSGCIVTGIDISERMLAAARAKGLSRLIHGDFATHAFGDAAFDGVWCLSMLQDLSGESGVEDGIKKLASLVKPGGFVFVVYPRFPAHPDTTITIDRPEYGIAESYVNVSANALAAMFTRASLRIVSEVRMDAAIGRVSGETKEYVEFVLQKDA